MAWREVLDLYDILDDAAASGAAVADWLRAHGVDDVSVTAVKGDKGTPTLSGPRSPAMTAAEAAEASPRRWA